MDSTHQEALRVGFVLVLAAHEAVRLLLQEHVLVPLVEALVVSASRRQAPAEEDVTDYNKNGRQSSNRTRHTYAAFCCQHPASSAPAVGIAGGAFSAISSIDCAYTVGLALGRLHVQL